MTLTAKRYCILACIPLLCLLLTACSGQASSYGIDLVEKRSLADIDPFTVGRMVEMGQIAERDLTPMVFLDDRLLASTWKDAYVTCGNTDGSILTSVGRTEIPAKEGQSNFGTGASYIRLGDGAAAVRMDQDFVLFLDSDTVEYNHGYYRKSDLSAETLAWLEFYSGLSQEEKNCISVVPPEFAKHAADAPADMETDSLSE